MITALFYYTLGNISPKYRFSDVAEIYSHFRTKQDITLWCFVTKGDDTSSKSCRKREIYTDNSAPLTKRGALRADNKRS